MAALLLTPVPAIFALFVGAAIGLLIARLTR